MTTTRDLPTNDSLVPYAGGLASSGQGSAAMQRAEEVRAAFQDLSALVLSTQDRLQDIAQRGFFGRMFANNTRDLALAMQDVVKMQTCTVQLVRVALATNARSLTMTRMIHAELEALRDSVGAAVQSQSGQADRLLQVQGTVDQMLLLTEQQVLAQEERERSAQQIAALEMALSQQRAERERHEAELASLRNAISAAAPQLLGARPLTLAKVAGIATAVAIGVSFVMTVALLRAVGP